MDVELYLYDIYPKVLPVGCPTEITIRMVGDNLIHKNTHGNHGKFKKEGRYVADVWHMDSGNDADLATVYPLTLGEDGMLRFTCALEQEGEYHVSLIHYDDEGNRNYLRRLYVYALEEDLASRIPLRGDFHVHTCRSDGKEEPALVCANYRKAGYDFMVITDHFRYYPSLDAQASYANADMALNIIRGEEVHLPLTGVHIVNAGGSYSVNGLLESSAQFKECGDDLSKRSADGKAPDMISREEYERQITEIMESGRCDGCPEKDKQSYAVCLWAFDHIKAGGGLAILAHPLWPCCMFNLSIPYAKYMLKQHPFDALEVLGGVQPMVYHEMNVLQAAMYYEEWAEGRFHPIVGSTDSHSSTETNRVGKIASTIVFAHANETDDIFRSVKDRYSVAVDSYSEEFRLVGPFRLQKYAIFLMKNWYPLYDRVTSMDGEIMREYYVGEAEADELKYMKGKAEAMFKKYFKTL